MRRFLILIAATGTLLVGCSSSNETSSSSSSTTSSVVITPANEKVCSDLDDFRNGLENSGFEPGETPAETAAALQALYAKTLPSLQTLKLSAPADLAPAIDVYIVQFTEASALDATKADDQQVLNAMILAPSTELKGAETTLRDWSAKNCGLQLPGQGS